MTYAQWFTAVTGHPDPRDWQDRLAADPECADRLIRIPTGMGKTEGVLGAWAWHCLVRNDSAWPRRLVWCLPMRVLVEQTAEVAERMLERAVMAQPGARSGDGAPRVVRLMGGTAQEPWHLDPERPAMLVGTQDMLLSRALNRGYGAGRARWPIDYGLLNHDALWVMDEVQLMDVGLATSVQLQAFRRGEAGKALRPCHTWWMSATLQPDWLDTADSRTWLPAIRGGTLRIPAAEQTGSLWEIAKPVYLHRIPAADDNECVDLAQVAWDAHGRSRPDRTGRMTLVIVNRVETALAVFDALEILRASATDAPDLRLVHSRFRPLERRGWTREFLSRAACEDPRTNRIVVATQVVEAGVDISASALVTELAPWSSLVQRFGRAARYGGSADVTVVDRCLEGKKALPYTQEELDAARAAITDLRGVGPAALERFETALERNDHERLANLYTYEPLHVLTRRESDELFDTGPDLSGADLDISRFIRSGEERDMLVCWARWNAAPERATAPPTDLEPLGDGSCPVPVYLVRKWLFDAVRLKEGVPAWIWDYAQDGWRRPNADDCYPGQVLLVEAGYGGYDVRRGFTGAKPQKTDTPIPVEAAVRAAFAGDAADRAQEREDLSAQHRWKTIATHGREMGDAAGRLAGEMALGPDLTSILELAGRVHDWGKAHPAFNTSITDAPDDTRPARADLAKAPPAAWARPPALYCRDPRSGPRHGFRHELATTLALFELLRRIEPDHEALLGPHRSLLEAGVLDRVAEDPGPLPTPLAAELSALDGCGFNLLAYLVCAHHGKVRGSWQGTARDQQFPSGDARFAGTGQPLLGIREGDELPALALAAANGAPVEVPPVTLHLDPAAVGLSGRFGASWTERVAGLLDVYGPFALAYLEALLRAADVRASRLDTPDPLLTAEAVTA